MPRLEEKSVTELLRLHVNIGEELCNRGILRSANNPTGDLAEYLFRRAFGWTQAPNSERGFDAVNTDGIKFQIKGRRLHKRSTSRQLSALRNLQENPFDVLAGVLFSDNYSILKAALIPISIVVENSQFTPHTNSHRFMLTDPIWESDGVKDVTENLSKLNLSQNP